VLEDASSSPSMSLVSPIVESCILLIPLPPIAIHGWRCLFN
jgi:hypothetical protein